MRRLGLLALGMAASACPHSMGIDPAGPALEIEAPTDFEFEVEEGRDAPAQVTRVVKAGEGTSSSRMSAGAHPSG